MTPALGREKVRTSPSLLQTWQPVRGTLTDSCSNGQLTGFAMLQGFAVDAEDKSFVMSLSTGTFAHSLAVQHQVSTITLLPQFSSQLAPIFQQVGLSVFQNGIKLQPTNLATSPASPLIRNHVYTIQLVPGQNTIDVWISAPLSGLFQGGVPSGKTETQQFFLFIQRSSI